MLCGKQFILKGQLRAHVKTHSLCVTRLECYLCDRKFRTYASLRRHIANHDDEEEVRDFGDGGNADQLFNVSSASL